MKTTIMGVLAALGLIATAISDALQDGWSAEDFTMIAAAVGIALQGVFSRDDNVTSEGTKVER
jgi:hypothetical protein